VEDAAKGGVYGTMGGATAGGLATGGLNGARIGAGAGAAAAIAWALLKRGSDVRLDVGTSDRDGDSTAHHRGCEPHRGGKGDSVIPSRTGLCEEQWHSL